MVTNTATVAHDEYTIKNINGTYNNKIKISNGKLYQPRRNIMI